ncbi:hypothetical protein AB8T93_11605 [Klebsiella pneumoniae]
MYFIDKSDTIAYNTLYLRMQPLTPIANKKLEYKMKDIINFLECSDSDWKIDLSVSYDYEEVAQKVGYIFNGPSKTKREVEEYLIQNIRIALQGDSITTNDFISIEKHININYFASNKKSHRNAYFFITYVRHLINVLDSYSNSLESWKLAKYFLGAYASISGNASFYTPSIKSKNEAIAESIKYLKAKGYKTSIYCGSVIIDDEDALLSAIKYKFNELGFHSISFILSSIKELYSFKSERYFFKKAPDAITNFIPEIPWGYLFNISLSNLHEVKYTRDTYKKFQYCIELTKNYFCIQGIQNSNQFSELIQTNDTILSSIQKNIIYDQHFPIEQIASKHFRKIIKGVFLSSKIISRDIKTNIYIDIFDWLNYRATHDTPYNFTIHDIAPSLEYKYSADELMDILNEISLNIESINKNYLRSEDISNKNYYTKPLIKINSVYIYINPTLSSYGFYYHLIKVCESKGVNGELIGSIIESFVLELLTRQKLNVLSNKKYKISKPHAKELSIKSDMRECDFIVETKKSVFFIELKRKTLTTEARSGDIVKSTIDLSQSLFHALAQTGCHEYLLRSNGRIDFTDGTYVELDNRRVERVVLSLFDFNALQDGAFVHEMLRVLIWSNIQSGDREKDNEMNKHLTELRNQYNTDLFQKEYITSKKFFFNCRFFSIPQLIEILSNSIDNDTFENEINRTRNITSGSKDWYIEYEYMRNLKS